MQEGSLMLGVAGKLQHALTLVVPADPQNASGSRRKQSHRNAPAKRIDISLTRKLHSIVNKIQLSRASVDGTLAKSELATSCLSSERFYAGKHRTGSTRSARWR